MGERDFLGSGWSFPPAFDGFGGSVRMLTGVENVEQGLTILLQTARGERVMHGDFGCAVDEFLFGSVSANMVGRLRDHIRQAIVRYEPRVRLNDVSVTPSDSEAGLLHVAIDYTVRATNSRFNMVYPFYLNEAAPGA